MIWSGSLSSARRKFMPHQLQDVRGGCFFKALTTPPPLLPSRLHVPWGSFTQANFTRTSSAETGRHQGRQRTQKHERGGFLSVIAVTLRLLRSPEQESGPPVDADSPQLDS